MTSSGGDDTFRRVASAVAGAPAKASAGKQDPGEHISPVPPKAPALPKEWPHLGAPVAAWAYRDATGQVLRYTLRFAKPDGDKEIRPATLWRQKPGAPMRWRPAAEPGKRPLYGLDTLAARPTAPVLLVEGEKSADAAAQRFPDCVAMTWPGGANAIGKADFTPLQGRRVLIWPDADDPGRKAAQAALRAASMAGAQSVAAVRLPAYLPKGWDLADDWPPTFGPADA
ncbi:MAG: hypothetical protein JWO33_998, partial [Caulobacteraceae bacterium]|nr:hypothetical protein [Caulobacteraceae bacterium]